MHSEETRPDGFSYNETANILELKKLTVQSIVKPTYKKQEGVGRPRKIARAGKMISGLKDNKKIINSTKLVHMNPELKVSKRILHKFSKSLKKTNTTAPFDKEIKGKKGKTLWRWFIKVMSFSNIIVTDES